MPAGNPTTWTSDSLGCISRTFCISAILNLQQLFLGTWFSKGRCCKVRPELIGPPRFSQVSLPDAIGCFNLPLLIIPYHPVAYSVLWGRSRGREGNSAVASYIVTSSYQFTVLHVARHEHVCYPPHGQYRFCDQTQTCHIAADLSLEDPNPLAQTACPALLAPLCSMLQRIASEPYQDENQRHSLVRWCPKSRKNQNGFVWQ